jgi:hypothetical protein
MVVEFADQQMDRYPQWPGRCAAHDLLHLKGPGLRGFGYKIQSGDGLESWPVGTEGNPMRRLLLLRRGVAHGIRVRLTVRYRTFVCAARQVVFVVQSPVAISQSFPVLRLPFASADTRRNHADLLVPVAQSTLPDVQRGSCIVCRAVLLRPRLLHPVTVQ